MPLRGAASEAHRDHVPVYAATSAGTTTWKPWMLAAASRCHAKALTVTVAVPLT